MFQLFHARIAKLLLTVVFCTCSFSLFGMDFCMNIKAPERTTRLAVARGETNEVRKRLQDIPHSAPFLSHLLFKVNAGQGVPLEEQRVLETAIAEAIAKDYRTYKAFIAFTRPAMHTNEKIIALVKEHRRP